MRLTAFLLVAAVFVPALSLTGCSPRHGGGARHAGPGDVHWNQHGRYKHGKRKHAEKKYMRPR
ncbi:MAG: hypothetical protein WD342_02315 [Verrucomicrobiales bacterium]